MPEADDKLIIELNESTVELLEGLSILDESLDSTVQRIAVIGIIGEEIMTYAVLHQLDQKITYPHHDFKHLTEKYFEIGMKLNDFSIQLVKYCLWIDNRDTEAS